MLQMRGRPGQNTFFVSIFLLLVIVAITSTPAVGNCRKYLNVQILAINDFHGQIVEDVKVTGKAVGGAVVLASYLKSASEGREGDTFIVHAGDLVGASSPESSLLQDEPSIMFFNMLGNKYCTTNNVMHHKCNLVGTVGNHEFDEGQEELLRLIYGGNHPKGPFLEDPWKGATFPYVWANVVRERTGETLLPPYVIKKVNNVPIAFIGAVLKDAPSIVTATGIRGLIFQDEVEAINRQVKNVKRQGVETIVALVHQGGYQSSRTDPLDHDLQGDIVNIVKALDSEVDVVITGHNHQFTNALVKNNKGAMILVTQAWSKGSAYADIDLEIDPNSLDVVRKTAQVVTTWAPTGDKPFEPDAKVTDLVTNAMAATQALTGRIIGSAGMDISRRQNEVGESALGNLIADAQRLKMGADFAFVNPGGIRADLNAGETTWGELYTIQPFNNYLVKMTLSGRQIYDLLHQQYTPYQPYNRILQISGLTYTWDALNDAIVEIRKDGSAIDTDAEYTVAVNSFLAGGGDKFSVLQQGTVEEIGPIDLDALIDFVKDLPQPFSASVEGRIKRLD